MVLNESLQDDIIEEYKIVIAKYEDFKNEVSRFDTICEDNENLKFESKILYDFCSEELGGRIEATKEAILDEYFPIYYGDDEDSKTAAEKYRNSKEVRDNIFA